MPTDLHADLELLTKYNSVTVRDVAARALARIDKLEAALSEVSTEVSENEDNTHYCIETARAALLEAEEEPR